jgi:hypothetical protein
MSPNDERISPKKYGVPHHKPQAYGGRKRKTHLDGARSELGGTRNGGGGARGIKLSLAETGVFQAADELQRLQKGVSAFKQAMRKIVESESTSQTTDARRESCCTARKRRR